MPGEPGERRETVVDEPGGCRFGRQPVVDGDDHALVFRRPRGALEIVAVSVEHHHPTTVEPEQRAGSGCEAIGRVDLETDVGCAVERRGHDLGDRHLGGQLRRRHHRQEALEPSPRGGDVTHLHQVRREHREHGCVLLVENGVEIKGCGHRRMVADPACRSSAEEVGRHLMPETSRQCERLDVDPLVVPVEPGSEVGGIRDPD